VAEADVGHLVAQHGLLLGRGEQAQQPGADHRPRAVQPGAVRDGLLRRNDPGCAPVGQPPRGRCRQRQAAQLGAAGGPQRGGGQEDCVGGQGGGQPVQNKLAGADRAAGEHAHPGHRVPAAARRGAQRRGGAGEQQRRHQPDAGQGEDRGRGGQARGSASPPCPGSRQRQPESRGEGAGRPGQVGHGGFSRSNVEAVPWKSSTFAGLNPQLHE